MRFLILRYIRKVFVVKFFKENNLSLNSGTCNYWPCGPVIPAVL